MDNTKPQKTFFCYTTLLFMTHRLKTRLTHFFPLSLITEFLSLKILPPVRHFLSKTLDFLRMDPFFFSADNDFNTSNRSLHSLSDLDDEKLFLVDHRWWNAVRESVFTEVEGVLYAASCGFSDEFESEIVVNMRSESGGGGGGGDCDQEDQGVSGREFAVVSEWIFYRTVK